MKTTAVRGIVSGLLVVAAAGAVPLTVSAAAVNVLAPSASGCTLPVHCPPISD